MNSKNYLIYDKNHFNFTIWGHGLQFISVLLLKCLGMQILILNSKDTLVHSEIKFERLWSENICSLSYSKFYPLIPKNFQEFV